MKKQKKYKPLRKDGKKFALNTGEKKATGRAKGYTKEWETFKHRFLHHNPRCYCCGKHKKDIRMDIDHVQSHKGDEKLFWKSDNLIPLCVVCHGIVTGLFDRGADDRTAEKVRWLQLKREHYGVNVVVKVVSTGKECQQLDM